MRPRVSIPSLVNRRVFLRGAASSSMFALLPQWVRAQRAQPAMLYVTDALEKHTPRPPLHWAKVVSGAAGMTIEIDSTRQYQPILGFGAATENDLPSVLRIETVGKAVDWKSRVVVGSVVWGVSTASIRWGTQISPELPGLATTS